MSEEGEEAFEAGVRSAFQYAKEEGWAYCPDALDTSVIAGNLYRLWLCKPHVFAHPDEGTDDKSLLAS